MHNATHAEGLGVRIRLRIDGTRGLIDVTTNNAVPIEDGHLVVALEPGWGRILRMVADKQ